MKHEKGEDNMKFVLKGGTLIDGRNAVPVNSASVKINGSYIEAVGEVGDFESTSNNMRTIDITGKTIMPGLINTHEHLTFKEAIGPLLDFVEKENVSGLTIYGVRTLLKLLRRGFTTVRDMGGQYGIPLDLRDRVNAGELLGPRVITCNHPISCTGGHAHELMSVEADGPDAMRQAARKQMSLGADFIKVTASHDPWPMPGLQKTRAELTPLELHAAFDEARQWGKRTTCHVMGEVAIRNVIEAGVDVIEHGIYLNDELAELMVEKGIYFTPTFSAYHKQTLNPKYKRGEKWIEAHNPLAEAQPDSVTAAIRAGVKIVNGTDSVGDYVEEIHLLREAGMNHMDSLFSCTSWAAEALGMDDIIGTIERGKMADIVVLNGNPLEDPNALEQVEMIIKNGKIIRPEDVNLPVE